MNSQNLANMAWSFAMLNRPDEKLFMAVARAAERLMSDFNVQILANMAWAFAMLDQLGTQLFMALAR